MKTWIIFDRNGLAKCEAHKLEYSGEFLGACSVNVEIASPTPIGFEIGDYLEYRGERFEMNYDPSVVKQASAGAHGESFLYSGVVFNALSDELTRCEFLDYVPSDNEMHYSSLPTFSFFAENVKVLAERIQVNLDRIYTGAKKWSVNIHGERTEAKNVNVTISNQSCWDALGLVKTLFGENFIVRGRTITIGTSGIVMGSTLTYGKGNGLCKIERNAESNQKIITRLRAYGSTRNMSPAYYRSLGVKVFGEVIWIVDREASDYLKCYLNIPYEEGLFADNGNVTVKINGVEAAATITKHEVKDEFEGCCVLYAASSELKSVTQDGMKAYFTSGVNKHRFPQANKEYLENVPNNMAVMHLMLPSFPNETLDPYLDSKHIDVLGVREGTVFFDGSNGLEEIYPTMEGMTAEDLKVSGVDVKAEGNLDEVVTAELIEDDGVPANINDIPPFQITLKDIGFDINQYLGTSQPAISMKDGMCGGREFEIQSCKKEGSNYVLTCNRSEDSSLGLFFPYKDYPIQTGDKFVLLNLEMPDVYVQAASQRLLKAAQDYLKKHDYVRYSYIPSVDNIYMARQHDEAIANGGVSIHDTIKEGDFLLFEDDDLGIKGSVTISSLRIKEDTSSSLIPEYDIVLQEEKTLGTIERIQNQINNIEAGGVTGSVNTEQVQGIVKSIADKNYLSKTKDDRSKGTIASDKGMEVGTFKEGELGSGAATFMRDGSSYSEVDFLKVRKKATFTNLTIQELKHVGGEIILSPAAMVVSKVEEVGNGYKCYFNTEDSDGRKVYNEFEAGDQAKCQTFNLEHNKYYWRLVVEVGDDFIVLSKTDCDANSDIPSDGDNISQLGNRTDASRQAAIILSAYGTDAPSYKQYSGIDSFSLEGKQVTKLSPYGNELTGKMTIESGSKGWENLEGLPSSIQTAVDLANKAQEAVDNTKIGAVNLLRNSGFTGDYQSEDMIAADQLDNGSELFSKKLDKWDGDAIVYTDANAVSGCSAQLGGISQSVKELIVGESYVVSFKARGSIVNISCGDFEVEQKLTSGFAKYSFKFKFGGSKVFSIVGNARICDLQLERGTISTDWNPSPYDNDKAYAEFQALKYLQDAIVNGNTSVLGGLILSSIVKLGNYKNGKMQKVNAGVSGIYNDDDDVAFWGGGTYEQAIKTMMKFKSNPHYKPTEEEWADMARFVVSHGGDAVFRGSVFADNGYFRGDVYADGGYFRGEVNQGDGATLLNPDGSGQLSNGAISWNQYGVMYRKSYDVTVWRSIEDSDDVIDLSLGLYIDLTSKGSTYTLPDALFDGTMLYVKLSPISRSDFCATLEGSFKARVRENGNLVFKPASKMILEVEDKEVALTYSLEQAAWIYDKKGVTIDENGLMIIGDVVESETEVVADKVASNSFIVGDKEGITQVIPVYENGGRSYFTFTSGILTGYSYEPNE